MKNLVQWGAGNIGRSFIGQVFSRSGFNVTFIDIDTKLIELLHRFGYYDVVEVSQQNSKTIRIEGVSAINGKDQPQIEEAIKNADILSLSVGKDVLPVIAPSLVLALNSRINQGIIAPLDIIIAENIHNGKEFLKHLICEHSGNAWEAYESKIGLVETSIGKMVPIQTNNDPLILTSEPYNTLIVDKDGFRGECPESPWIQAVSPIAAYVDRKLFIHNLGHATAAYIGYALFPDVSSLSHVISNHKVRELTSLAMSEAAEVLLSNYPTVFTRTSLQDHIVDLIQRFSNTALGDTVFRVGRDLKRKLRYDDRLLGVISQAHQKGLPWTTIGLAYRIALNFRATDTHGELFNSDKKLIESLKNKQIKEQILEVSALRESSLPHQLQEEIIQGLLSIDIDI